MAAQKPNQRRKHGGVPRTSPHELQIPHDDHRDMTMFLQLPLFPASPASPARSQASTTNSVSRAMSDMAINDRPPEKRMRRGGRIGPLSEETKRRAGLMRKAGACTECRRRKVRCTHVDVSHLECPSQEKRSVDPSTLEGNSPIDVNVQRDLFGVGGEHSSCLQTLGGVAGDLHPEYDLVLDPPQDQQPIREDVTAALALFAPQGRADDVPQTGGVPFSTDQYQFPISIPIGTEFPWYSWGCLWGSDEMRSCVSMPLSEPCNWQGPNRDDFNVHFISAHAPIQGETDFWKCQGCGFYDRQPHGLDPCPSCKQYAAFWQRYCFAFVPSSTLSSSYTAQVRSEDAHSVVSSRTSYSYQLPTVEARPDVRICEQGNFGYGNPAPSSRLIWPYPHTSRAENLGGAQCPTADLSHFLFYTGDH